MADVFDEPPVIVDGNLLEAAKENIQPLAKGRRVTTLASVLSTPHAQRESRLSSARSRHRINVEVALEDEDDDALDAYARFVDWTVENYPQGHSAESGLLELLEEATRVLKDHCDGMWRDDIRYLKLWVLYANYVEKPAIIYKFCVVNEIGTSHSLLYEEYATVLERANRRAEADEVYLLGIARRAMPLDRLESKHREFQKRMMASINLSPPANDTPPTAPRPSSRRTALAESSSSSTRTRPNRSGSTRAPPSAAGDVFSAPADAPRPNGRIPVFVDPTGAGAENDPAQAAPWPELGTRKARVKENIPEVRKAAGTTLRQPRSARAGSTSTASRIPVYRDPEPAAEMPPPGAPGGKKGKSAIAVFRDEDAPPEGSGSGSAPRKEKGKSSVPVFRDEEAADSGAMKGKKGKSSIAVFRDEDEGTGAAPTKKGKAQCSIDVFRDDAEEESAAAHAGKKHDKGKSSITVFRDEEPPVKARPVTPSTPGFTPYCDADEPVTPSASHAPSSVMKPKRRDALGLTESEVLRRDPFKNYAPEDRPAEE